ncbi:hypothetical protein [Agrococcus baldri]|uniref:Uncharacterized protein n=1 Tax=Agrococcus baldri TaxID=153730 RepID=A0AA87RDZ7_9MICO|nr:hypothetical protein [Agrococcus baldri]GEK79044.1 hypothetical protein ABA31_03950 [Agrococcus baldri]
MGTARRTAGIVGIATVTVAALTGCIPSPPPVPQPSPAEPIVPGATSAGEVREGMVPAGGTSTVELQVDERSAVVIGATSPDDEDLTLHLTGPGVDVENDDAHSELDVFAFELDSRDPALAAVLEPGAYSIEVGEWSDDRSSFELQALTTAATVPAGTSADFDFAPGAPAIAIVPLAEGDESIAATSDVDTTLWAYLPESDTEYRDDDSGGDRNPLIELPGERPQDAVVVATGYDRDESGSLQLTVG